MAPITRKQYIDFRGDNNARRTIHQAYFSQFASKEIVSFIAGKFSPQELVDAYKKDQHLNNIDLPIWDDLARAIYPWIDHELLKTTGQFWSLSTGVCTCKAAAKILISRALATPCA